MQLPRSKLESIDCGGSESLDLDQEAKLSNRLLIIQQDVLENFGYDRLLSETKTLPTLIYQAGKCLVQSEGFVEALWGEVEDNPDCVPGEVTQRQLLLCHHLGTLINLHCRGCLCLSKDSTWHLTSLKEVNVVR